MTGTPPHTRRAIAAALALLAVLASCTSKPKKPVASPASTPTPAQSASPSPSGPPPVFDGRLLIADRGNNRLLLVDVNKNRLWAFPSRTRPAPPDGFYFPDDAFFTGHGTGIITNEEEQHTIIRIAFPSGKVTWSYGHPRVPGGRPGYLNQPDDAYLLADGTVMVADAKNCRIIMIDHRKKITGQIGRTGDCSHHPPRTLAYPNGDTPLENGNILVSEINGSYVDEITPSGKLVWSVHLPFRYPSDPQQIGPNRYLVASYARPGGIFEFDRKGKIIWHYRYASGERMLDHPRLAEQHPNGSICVNDDYRHRVVIIDKATKRIVWQYGHTGVAGRAPGYLNTPDGFDLLAPDKTTPTHAFTG